MSKKRKKKKIEVDKKKMYDMTSFIKKHTMSYVLTLIITAPIIMFVNYFLSNNIEGYTTVITVLVTIVALLFALLITTLIYIRNDRRERESADGQKDPFADEE